MPLVEKMMREFESTWWSIELVPGWYAEREDCCTTISSEEGVGALQVGAYHHNGEPVSEKDLSEFSEGEYPESVIVLDHRLGAFSGLHVPFQGMERIGGSGGCVKILCFSS